MTKVATAISVTSGSLSPQTKVSSRLAGPPVHGLRVLLDQVYKEECSQIMQRFPLKRIFAKFAMFIIYAQFWRGPLGTISMIHHLIPRTHHSYVSCIFAHNAY